jgi:hypothetical protein
MAAYDAAAELSVLLLLLLQVSVLQTACVHPPLPSKSACNASCLPRNLLLLLLLLLLVHVLQKL